MLHFAKLGPGYDRDRRGDRDAARDRAPVPGRMTYSQWLPPAEHAVQRKADGERASDPAQVHAHAAAGVRDARGKLPFVVDIQRAFGRHDISRVAAQVGGAARDAARAIGAAAYAYGERVAFASEPDLRTAAHEAAHVVQQRAGVALAGGVGATGDRYEQQADAIAELVAAGQSAEPLLDACVGGAIVAAHAAPAVQREDADHDGVDDALVECALPAEALDALLDAIRRTPTIELAATATALTPAARRRTRADAVYQFPLAHRARAARGSDLAAIADAVRRTTHLSLETVELRQDWAPYEAAVDSLVDDRDTASHAVLANALLGFQPQIIQALWRRAVPEVTRRRTVFTRTFTDALPRLGLPRVLDEASVRQLDVAAALPAPNLRDHYDRGPWRALSDDDFARIAQQLAAHFGVDAALARSAAPPRGRRGHRAPRVSAHPAFVTAVMNWQAWHHRSDESVAWGKLDTADLAQIGIALPGGESAAAESSAPTSEASESIASIAPESAESTESAFRDPRILAHDYLTHIDGYTAEVAAEARAAAHASRRPRHGEPAPAELVGPPAPPARERLARYLDDTVLPGMANLHLPTWSPAQLVRRGDTETVSHWTSRVRDALAELSGDGPPHTDDAAAIAALDARHLLVGMGTLHIEGWDERLYGHMTLPDGTRVRTDTPAARAAIALPILESYRDRLQRLLPPLTDGLSHGGSALRNALTELARADLTPPELVRHRWHVTWPDRPNPDASEGAQRNDARLWRTTLGTVLRTTLSEIRTTPAYLHPIINDNPDAVFVDLNRTGVELTNNHGNVLPASDLHLDPVFAQHMADFLCWLASIGVTRMWTAGFLRSAMSPQDTHPMGLACDITGFTFAPRADTTQPEVELLLRNGQPGRDGALGSAWFDHHNRLGEHTYAELMTGIAAHMTHHFDRIIGPGHNPEHMNHFHVETSPTGPRPDGLRLFAVASASTHLPDTVRHTADARDAHWSDAITPLPLASALIEATSDSNSSDD